MKERRNQERRRWGRKVTYPFIDSEGVLVTKNRRRNIDRRDEIFKEEEAAKEESFQPAVAGKSEQENKNTSIDISESKVMELEEALKSTELSEIKTSINRKSNDSENKPVSGIMASIKNLEEEILGVTNIEAISHDGLEVTSKKNVPENKQVCKPKIIEKNTNGTTIELIIKGKKHVLTTDKNTCRVGRDPSCDIVIQNKFVSREHAKIILKDGKFLVVDNSFNGTYVKFNNGQKIHISKDEQTLIANGTMSMGKPVEDGSNSVIEFKISL
jgi:negative regulator of replication initiation